MASFLSRFFPRRGQPAPALDYGQLIVLDAEDLAEQGILAAYERLLPRLRQFVPTPAAVEEVVDEGTGRYAVRCQGREYVVYAPELPGSEGQSWGRAAHALFALVNEQLAGAPVLLYAINGGNDLGGLFLTPEQARAAQAALPAKSDWPYLPTLDHPLHGQYA